MASASAYVLASGQVGPDAMALGSSPVTSLMISVVIGALQAAARRPPWMRDKCLRTMFMSVIGAPDFSRDFVTAFRSAIGTAATGSDSRLEPPPETSAMSLSSGPREATRARISAAAFSPSSSGTGWLASTTVMRSVGSACA